MLLGGLCCSAGASRRLNLLIAVMGDSFEKVKADEAPVAMFEQAQVTAISTLPLPQLTSDAHAQRIVEYERLLIGFRCWSEKDSEKFPRFMLIAEEAKGKANTVADGVSGRVRWGCEHFSGGLPPSRLAPYPSRSPLFMQSGQHISG